MKNNKNKLPKKIEKTKDQIDSESFVQAIQQNNHVNARKKLEQILHRKCAQLFKSVLKTSDNK